MQLQIFVLQNNDNSRKFRKQNKYSVRLENNISLPHIKSHMYDILNELRILYHLTFFTHAECNFSSPKNYLAWNLKNWKHNDLKT